MEKRASEEAYKTKRSNKRGERRGRQNKMIGEKERAKKLRKRKGSNNIGRNIASVGTLEYQVMQNTRGNTTYLLLSGHMNSDSGSKTYNESLGSRTRASDKPRAYTATRPSARPPARSPPVSPPDRPCRRPQQLVASWRHYSHASQGASVYPFTPEKRTPRKRRGRGPRTRPRLCAYHGGNMQQS